MININGKEFTTKWKNLSKYPSSRLGKIYDAVTIDEIRQLCDGFLPGSTPVIFFFRNPNYFSAVLDSYRDGRIHVMEHLCPIISEDEFRFWGLDEMLLEPCCLLKHIPRAQEAHNEVIEEINENRRADRKVDEECFKTGPIKTIRQKLWDLLEYPETSRAAQFFAFTSLMFVISSTCSFMIESFIEDYVETTEEEKNEKDMLLKILNQADIIFLGFFTAEYLLRFILCPNKNKFLSCKMNLVDLFGISPFYLSLIVSELEDMQIIGKASKIIRLLRLMRILRIFKMVRHFVGLQSLLYTIHRAYKEIGMILIIFAVTVIVFSTLGKLSHFCRIL